MYKSIEKLFNNIGKKIKALAVKSFVILSLAAAITGIVLLAVEGNQDLILIIGLLLIFAAPIVILISSWLLYGFGEIVDKTCDIERNTRCRANIADIDINDELPEI